MSDVPTLPPGMRLDSISIDRAKPYLATLSRDSRLAMLPEARAQEARRLKEALSRHPFYAKWTDKDWERLADSYSPGCLID